MRVIHSIFFSVFVFFVGFGIRLCGSVGSCVCVNCDITFVRLRIVNKKIPLDSRENENEYCSMFIHSVQFGIKLDSRFARLTALMLIKTICIIRYCTHLFSQQKGGTCGLRRSDIRLECSQFAFISISRFVLSAIFSRRTRHQLDVDVNENDGNSNLEMVVIGVNVLFF